MKSFTVAAAIAGAAGFAVAAPPAKRDVYTNYPYTGPKIPVGDWVDPTVRGNGKGFPRLVEKPAVAPASLNPTNNINVISTSYTPNGVNIHFQTPFGLDSNPSVKWGTSESALSSTATGMSTTYDRTPPCSLLPVVQCSQYFHNVQLSNLKSATTYYYQIAASNGTTESPVLSFKTAHAAGDSTPFTVGILNDMGYTNALGTQKYLAQAANGEEIDFAWHGGDISYADDWYSGILPCTSDWPVCYNGSKTELPGGPPYPSQYLDAPLPKGEIPDQGGPQGGDMSVLYESNWDLWQQWMNNVTMKIPYMTLPGNHEAACAEFDGGPNILTAYLNDDKANSSAPKSDLTYYSCPPSQRNFTTYQYRFKMPGDEVGGAGNFWYSFDYGLVHFISFQSETDYPYSPSYPFIRDTNGQKRLPLENETYITDAGPFGYIDGSWKKNDAYEQYHFIKQDLAKVDRKVTPWVVAMSHRPMWSSEVASYQSKLRDAFQDLFLEYNVDLYLAGHIHWYERMWPLTSKGHVDHSAIVNNSTYKSKTGSLIHITNGMAGNVESHSTLDGSPVLNITNHLDQKNYGFSKLKVESATKLTWQMIMGKNGQVGDEVTITKSSS